MGAYDLRFTIYDAASGGGQVVGYNTFEDFPVVQGVFTVELSRSRLAWETAEARYLQVEVRPGASTGGPIQPTGGGDPSAAGPRDSY
jgi:hypothetical protein